MNKQFSFIELIVAVVVMALLVGFALPQIMDAITSDKEKVLVENLKVMRQAIEQFRVDRRHMPPGLRYPVQLSDLVSAGYLSAIPEDPFTRNTAWEYRAVGTSAEIELIDYDLSFRKNWMPYYTDGVFWHETVRFVNGTFENSFIYFDPSPSDYRISAEISVLTTYGLIKNTTATVPVMEKPKLIRAIEWRNRETAQVAEAYVVVLENNNIYIVQYTSEKCWEVIACVDESSFSAIQEIAITERNEIYILDNDGTDPPRIYKMVYDEERAIDNFFRPYVTKGIFGLTTAGDYQFLHKDHPALVNTGSASGDYDLRSNVSSMLYYREFLFIGDNTDDKLMVFDRDFRKVGFLKGGQFTNKDGTVYNGYPSFSSLSSLDAYYTASYNAFIIEAGENNPYDKDILYVLDISARRVYTVLIDLADRNRQILKPYTFGFPASNFFAVDIIPASPALMALRVFREVYIVDSSNHRVVVYTLGGIPLGWIGYSNVAGYDGWQRNMSTLSNFVANTAPPVVGNGTFGMRNPSAIEISNGAIAVTDFNNNRIIRWKYYGGIFDVRSSHNDYNGDRNNKRFHHKDKDTWLRGPDGSITAPGEY